MIGVVVGCDLEILFENKLEVGNELVVCREVVHVVNPENKNKKLIAADEMEQAFVEN